MTIKTRKEVTDSNFDNRDPITDLASTLKQAKDEEKIYICSECDTPLIHDPLYKQQINPFGGEAYYCPNISEKCSLVLRHIDSSLVRLKVQPKATTAAIPGNDKAIELFLEMVPENSSKGLMLQEDPYDEINARLEPDEEAEIHGMGGEIIHSEIILTDSSGANHTTVVKRNTPDDPPQY